jgi:hypothetical protein
MKRYLLSIYQPDGPRPAPELLAPVMRDVEQLIADAKSAGVWVFNGGLHDPGAATVVRRRDGEMLTIDGPYTEGKEHVGGFMVIKVPDLDAALEWARRLATVLTIPIPGVPASSLPIEVRPFEEGH